MAQDNGQMVTFKVTTDQLRETSDRIRTGTRNIQTDLKEMQESVSRTTAFWEGEGAESCRNAFAQFQDGIQELIARLSEHVSDLNAMAGIYDEGESQAVQATEVLSENVII